MPELPEVETVVRTIRSHIEGKRIVAVELHSNRVTRQDHPATRDALNGATILAVNRTGKQIRIDLDRGLLYAHLGMTGKLLWAGNNEPRPKANHVRAALTFEDGVLLYDDPRMFGRIEFYPGMPSSIAKVGPDALSITADEFRERVRKRKSPIKAVLLNQTVLSGVGNIYADEALHAAHIHPRASVLRLSDQRLNRLHAALVSVLAEAVNQRGSSISDYVDGNGRGGTFQTLHQVYGREGEPCLRCGGTVRRILLAQRSTSYCPRCQRA